MVDLLLTEVGGLGLACGVTSEEQVSAGAPGAVVFVASDLASYVTGTVTKARGGRYM